MKIIDKVKRRRFLESQAKLPDGKIWETRKHNSWGDNLHYSSRTEEGHEWVGWLPAPPQPGDLIEAPVNNPAGTDLTVLARFKVLEIRRAYNVDDMFYALTPHKGRIVEGAS